jgi:2-oxoglutarate ferredoxin oxidoreductase subunit gamma
MTETAIGDRIEIRLSGSGGQGLIFAGILLAEAVAIYGGKNVAQTQSYGPEARGGASRSDIVISDDIISYPKTTRLDILLALTQEACDSYFPILKEDGILIVDSSFVKQAPTEKAFSMPFTHIAFNKIGTPVVANVMALGALAAITGVVKRENLESVIMDRAPKGTEEKNKAALHEGYKMGEILLKEHKMTYPDTAGGQG